MKLEYQALLWIGFGLANYGVHAQVSTRGLFKSSNLQEWKEEDLAIYELPHQDNDKHIQLALDEAEKDHLKPFKFGQSVPFELSAVRDGEWSFNEDHTARIWRAEIVSEEAFSLSLIFDDFYLPPGAELYVIGKDSTLGAFTGAINNKDNGEFATAPIPGDTVLIEYFEPIVDGDKDSNKPEQPRSNSLRLKLSSVVHGFRRPYNHGHSGSCNIDVACQLRRDKGWRDQVNSVAVVIINKGETFCTGTVLNNSEQDGRQLFLTAYHCTSPDIVNSIVGFNFQRQRCGKKEEPYYHTCHGLKPLALMPESDMALFEIRETIPDDYNVYYAGWNAAKVAPKNVTCIHHPWGDVKKVSRYYGTCQWSGYMNETTGHHWRIPKWDEGTTEKGSSGSVLFDDNGLVVGHLHGGAASCNNRQGYDAFGALVSDWDYSDDKRQRLDHILNPLGLDIRRMTGGYYRTGDEGSKIAYNPYAHRFADNSDDEEESSQGLLQFRNESESEDSIEVIAFGIIPSKEPVPAPS